MQQEASPIPPDPAYERALAFWYGRINYEQRTPCPDDLKLDCMRALLQLLGNPQQRLRIVHIAGSKGKGSTAAMLAAVLRQAGYRTGLFTSPHLTRIEERIQIDGQPIAPLELTRLLEDVRAALTSRAGQGLEPTFFEIATALGFLHFVRQQVETAVIEVGLGGRFDSTNVCQPDLAVITSISLDHTRQLGDRLDSIAREKAGIIKPGKPVISGVTAPPARTVIEQTARQRQAPLRQLDVDFRYRYKSGFISAEETQPPQVEIITTDGSWPWLKLSLLGEHQAANAAVAVATVEQLRQLGWHISDKAVETGLASVHWPARLEVLGYEPLVILDCAHNVASAQALVETLQASFPSGRRWLIFAGSNDKDLSGMFRVLGPHFFHAFLTRYQSSSRSVPPQELLQILQRSASLPCTIYSTALAAWQAARLRAEPDDLICVTGSVFLAGELRPLLVRDASVPASNGRE